MTSTVFREYDIRGLAGTELDAGFYEKLGLAFGTYLERHGDESVVVGRDLRPTSEGYAEALTRGLVASGRRVLDVGVVTTPMAVFGLNLLGAHASCAVTASHNPAEYNGLKVRRRTPVFGEELQRLRALMEKGDFVRATGSREEFDVRDAYLLALRGRAKASRALKVVVDAGNGAAGIIAPDALDRLGFQVVPLYCEPDGTFPNHHPDPTVTKNLADLREEVEKTGADCGVAFDGDADRVVFVDETGAIHWPDRILMALAAHVLPRRPGGLVVYDVKCSQGIEDVVRLHGGEALMVRTGYPHLLAGMAKPGAVLGAELSGHMYFGGDPVFNFDDGVHAACRVLDVFSRDPRPVSEQLAGLPHHVGTPEIRADVPEDRKFDITRQLVEAFRKDPAVVRLIDIDGARVVYPEGWGLVRASNTQPSLVLVFESQDEAGLDALRGRFAEKLSSFPEVHHDLV